MERNVSMAYKYSRKSRGNLDWIYNKLLKCLIGKKVNKIMCLLKQTEQKNLPSFSSN